MFFTVMYTRKETEIHYIFAVFCGWPKGPPTSFPHMSCVVAAAMTVDRNGYVTCFCESNSESIVIITGYQLTGLMHLGPVHTPGYINH